MSTTHTPWPASHSSSLEDDISEHLEVLRQLRDLREGQIRETNRLDIIERSIGRLVDSHSTDSLYIHWLARNFKRIASHLGMTLPSLPDEKDG